MSHKRSLLIFMLIAPLTIIASMMFLSATTMAAVISLPKTGQTTCYDADGNVIDCAGTGQDGDVQAGVDWPDPRFTDHGDGTMSDNLTGLMWTQDGELAGFKTWPEALDFVAGMNAGTHPNFGYTDWRLPNIRELMSLSNKGVSQLAGWLVEQGFINVYPSNGRNFYWSSTTMVGPANQDYVYAARAYIHNVLNDHVWCFEKTQSAYVWPVRAGQRDLPSPHPANVTKTGQTTCYDASGNEIDCAGTGQDGELQWGVAWPDPRFTDNGDGTVTDKLTGLTWAQDPSAAGEMTWQQALDYAASLTNASDNDEAEWRLPNFNELASLLCLTGASTHLLPLSIALSSIPGLCWTATTFPFARNLTLGILFRPVIVAFVFDIIKLDAAVVWMVNKKPEQRKPKIGVSPAEHYFNSFQVGETSPPQEFIITNTGDENLMVTGISVLGDEFTYVEVPSTWQCQLPTTLSPGDSCRFLVSFTPSEAGLRGGSVQITSNDPDTPVVQLLLAGRGYRPEDF